VAEGGHVPVTLASSPRGDRKRIRSSLLRQGLPEREAVEGDAPSGAAAEQQGVDGSLFLPLA